VRDVIFYFRNQTFSIFGFPIYKYHFIGGNPPDTALVPVRRTIGTDQLVDELLFSFTHTSEVDWMLPCIEPTGRKVEIPLVAIVRFVDGTTGLVDLADFLVSHAVDGTLFEALRDDVYFARAHVIDGVVRWPNGADIAPDAMYETVRERRSTAPFADGDCQTPTHDTTPAATATESADPR
jgi:hypothetical protein